MDSTAAYTMTIDVRPPSTATPPAHCNRSDPNELLCATLTVADLDRLSQSPNHGYSGSNGSLSETQFAYKGDTYTIGEFSLD